jgi:hypothetical protein
LVQRHNQNVKSLLFAVISYRFSLPWQYIIFLARHTFFDYPSRLQSISIGVFSVSTSVSPSRNFFHLSKCKLQNDSWSASDSCRDTRTRKELKPHIEKTRSMATAEPGKIQERRKRYHLCVACQASWNRKLYELWCCWNITFNGLEALFQTVQEA